MNALEPLDLGASTLRALLLEDNPGDARLIQEIAGETGMDFDFSHVGTVADALAALAGSAFDIAISDLGLPDSAGSDAVTALRSAAPHLPIIVLTGSAAEDQGVAVLRAGADDYLVKGHIEPDGFGRAVRYAMERRSSARRAESALREEGRIIETLHRIGSTLAAQLDLKAIVQTVTDEATAVTGAAFGAFFYNVVDAEGESFTLYTLSGIPHAEFAPFPMPRNTHVFGPTFRGEGVVRSDDITKDPRYGHNAPYHGMPEGHPPVRSYLAVSVFSRDGEALGGLFFGHPDVAVFTERDEQVVVGIAGWAALAMDNARLYEAEHHARTEAEDANRAKSDFLATMSHELRTPLNAMIGYTDLWLMGLPAVLPEPITPQVERLKSSAQHLLELIEEILTFSRLEAAQERLDPEDTELTELVVSAAGLVEPLALAKGLRFEVRHPKQPVAMRTDPRKVRQILINLLSNAVKFTREGKIELVAEEDGDDVVFSVCDTGPGLEPAEAERVFEPFWQGQHQMADRPAGTGLGLAVSRRLAHLMGGEIELTAVPGVGCRFSLRVPLVVPDEPVTAKAPAD